MVEQIVHWYTIKERPITKDSRNVFIQAKIEYVHIERRKIAIPIGIAVKCAEPVIVSVADDGELVLIAKDDFVYSLDEVTLWTDDIKIGVRY